MLELLQGRRICLKLISKGFNEADIAYAEAQGKSPGGDIFIHGGPRKGIDPMNKRDWTAGCISVTDRQIEDIYAMVRDGTPIDIYA